MKSIKLKNEGSLLVAKNEVRADIFSGSLTVFRNRKPSPPSARPRKRPFRIGRSQVFLWRQILLIRKFEIQTLFFYQCLLQFRNSNLHLLLIILCAQL
jgi:hypothetical protein